MIFTSARQMKDRLKNEAQRLGIPPMTVMNHYMMEQLLARLAASTYKDRVIIKGGFLIASMIGVDLRTTQDLDATIKGLPLPADDSGGEDRVHPDAERVEHPCPRLLRCVRPDEDAVSGTRP